MPLPNTFQNLTTASMVMLDQNFNSLGVISTVPCAVSGTDAITLTPTPASATPNVVAYQNYMGFSGIVGITNTGTVTFRVGALASLNGFIDTPVGPRQIDANELIQNNLFVVVYDSSLGGGTGGFHLWTMPTPSSGGTISGNIILPGEFARLWVPSSTSSVSFQGLTSIANVRFGQFTGTFNSNDSVAKVFLSSSLSSVAFNGLTSIATVRFGQFTGTLNSNDSVAQITLPSSTSTVAFGGATTLASVVIGSSGAFIRRMPSSLVSIVFGVIDPANESRQTVALVGARHLDNVMIGAPSAVSTGVLYEGFVQANDTVVTRAVNISAGTITLAGGIYRLSGIGWS